MKKLNRKKLAKSLNISVTVAALSFSSISLAASPSGPNSGGQPASNNGDGVMGSNGIVQAIQDFSNRMTALATSANNNKNRMLYQSDDYLDKFIPEIKTPKSSSDSMLDNTQLTNLQMVKAMCTSFPNHLAPPKTYTADVSPTGDKQNTNNSYDICSKVNQLTNVAVSLMQTKDNDQDSDNQQQEQPDPLTELTYNTPASDTLYADSGANPSDLHNDYFNFNTLIKPVTYTPAQYAAAQYYIQYFTQDYKSLSQGIDYSSLINRLNSVGNTKKQQKWLENNVLNTDTYKQYQADVRSVLSLRSLILSNLNYLINERTSDSTLNKATAKNSEQQTSPLGQVDNALQATVNNPDWYKAMKSASPATIAREQLFLLATLVKQQERNRQLQERSLATLTALTNSIIGAKTMQLKSEANKVNGLFSTNSGSTNSSSFQPLNNSQTQNGSNSQNWDPNKIKQQFDNQQQGSGSGNKGQGN